jgi:hypothetical protein
MFPSSRTASVCGLRVPTMARLLLFGVLVASMASEGSAFQAGCSRGSFRCHQRVLRRQKCPPPQLLSLRGGEQQGRDSVAAEGRDVAGENGIAKEKGMFDVLFLGSGVSVIILPGPGDLTPTLRCAALHRGRGHCGRGRARLWWRWCQKRGILRSETLAPHVICACPEYHALARLLFLF